MLRSHLHYIHSNQQEGTGRLNFAVPAAGLPPQAYQYISLKTCSPGFLLNEAMGSCECRSFLGTHHIACDSINKTLTPRPLNWIGLIRNDIVTNEYIGFAPFCPTTYYDSNSSLDVTIMNTSLCLNNRLELVCFVVCVSQATAPL